MSKRPEGDRHRLMRRFAGRRRAASNNIYAKSSHDFTLKSARSPADKNINAAMHWYAGFYDALPNIIFFIKNFDQ